MSLKDKYFKIAAVKANEALALEEKEDFKSAKAKYIEAAELLMEFIKINKNLTIQKLCEERIESYIKRAKDLEGALGDDSIEIGEDGKPKKKIKSKEEEKLAAAIADTIVSEKPNVRWDDVANLEVAKQALREAIILPMKRPDLFKGARKPWKGVLLFGPPGCGKTMIAKAVANEVDATFFNADSGSLVSKWLGESERLIKQLFKLARENAPSLIFMDEVDSLTTTRGGSSGEGGGERRIKTQLLQEIDGVASGEARLVVLGATNTPWEIDAAMRRRFEKRIYIGLPELEARIALFKIHTKGVELDSSVNFKELANLTEGYSGSDISMLCRESIMNPVRELDVLGNIEEIEKTRAVFKEDFLGSIELVKPTVSKNELKKYTDWADEFGGI
ncbi:MAG: AAA family ATPase [Candidatus Lokiarchaeota archaeon]|nr:AAA family ATPase [Candidatus Lokiarchaeota archaeon]